MAYDIQFKRATAARIAEVPNTVLLAGEPLLDTTNNRLYIGDGATTLSNLKPIQNTQGVLDDMVTKGLLTSTTTTTTTTHNYTTDILQLDSNNSPQGFITALDSTTTVCALSDSAEGNLDFKINLRYPVTTGTLSSGDLESMVQVYTTNAGWGNISITWINNGVETTFHKYLGDMTQTLTREGPFQYRTNSENNIVVFIDPQTTLKSVAIINNYYCNNRAVIRLTNATYESTESVTTYTLNLPTATSSTLGMVKPDNSTITVDVNGMISANVPDMSGYYTKTQTDSLLDGKIDNDIVQSPLQYLPDTTKSIKIQNFNGSPLAFSGENGYFSTSSQSNGYFYLKDKNGNYVDIFINFNAVNFDNLGWVEAELTNGLNITSKAFSYEDGAFRYGYVLGHYNNNVFIPDAVIRGAENYSESIEIISTRGYYNTSTSGNYSPIYVAVYKPVGSTTLYIASKYKNFTRTLTSEEAAILDNVTHIRVLPMCSMSGRTYTTSINSIKVVNPNPNTTIVTSENDEERLATYNSGTNIFDAHPASLSLKYDSTTLGVNASNELTVPTATTSNLGLVKPDGSTITINNGVISAAGGSTPSNMVTTNTSQTITGQKTFSDTAVFYGEYGPIITDRINDYNSGKGVRLTYQGISIHGNGTSAKIDLSSSSNLGQTARRFTIYQGNDETYFNQDEYISDKRIFRNNTSSNFLLEKDMLDGTYLKWDSTTNKITVDIQAIKDAIDALSSSSAGEGSFNGGTEFGEGPFGGT